MAEKETPNEARLRRQKELDERNLTDYGMYDRKDSLLRKIKQAIKGENDYGTELSDGAMYARGKEASRAFNEDIPRPSIGTLIGQYPSVMKAGREAAAEERREARGMKSGGKVSSASKRADGIAKRGKTRGKMV